MFSRISEVGPNRKLVPSTPRLSFWTVSFRHNHPISGPRGDAQLSNFTVLISSYLICIIGHSRSIFSTHIWAVLLRDCRKKIIPTVLHKIVNFPGKITLLNFFKNSYADICLVFFFFGGGGEYYGFPETEIIFF